MPSDRGPVATGWTAGERFLKRVVDVVGAALGLLLFGWLIAIGWVLASFDTKRNGFFTQTRIGKNGRPFRVIKLRTMRPSDELTTTVTTEGDPRITPIGRFLRRTKMDELPQLLNVLVGQMSLVGPRPDVPGFADRLNEEDRIILAVRPGITGPATLRYRHEEALLGAVDDPESYNREVIFPDKVRLNREYVHNWSLKRDLYYIWVTVVGR